MGQQVIRNQADTFGQQCRCFRLVNRHLRGETQPERIGEGLMIKIELTEDLTEAFEWDEAMDVVAHGYLQAVMGSALHTG